MTNLFEQVWIYASSGGWLLGLLGYFVKSSLVLLAALLVQPLLKTRPPAVRHLVMRSAFLGVLALTLLWPLLPSWQMNWPAFMTTGLSATVAVLQPQIISSADSTIATTNVHWSVWVLSLWLAGCMIAGTRYLLGILSALNLARTAVRIDCPELTHAAERIARDFGLRQPVRVLISERLSVPIVFGLFRATILLPTNVAKWSPERRDLVLRHEFAHVKRRDNLWIHLTSLATIFHWFNPLVWAARGQMVTESEYACDDSVIKIGVPSSDYAQHLLDYAREAGRLDRSVRAGVALAYNTQLEGRIMSILANRKRATHATVKLTAVVTAVMLALALPLVGLSWQAQAGETPTTEIANKNEQAAEEAGLPKPDDFVEVGTYPEMTYQETPVYPDKSKQAGVEGKVWVKALIDKTGKVADVRLARTSSQKSLDESALTAAWKCKFTPATVDSKPVAVWVTYAVKFALDDKKESDK